MNIFKRVWTWFNDQPKTEWRDGFPPTGSSSFDVEVGMRLDPNNPKRPIACWRPRIGYLLYFD